MLLASVVIVVAVVIIGIPVDKDAFNVTAIYKAHLAHHATRLGIATAERGVVLVGSDATSACLGSIIITLEGMWAKNRLYCIFEYFYGL